jgi:phosphoribulokinase
MAERGHSLESIKASIEARKPDFDAYIGKNTLIHH